MDGSSFAVPYFNARESGKASIRIFSQKSKIVAAKRKLCLLFEQSYRSAATEIFGGAQRAKNCQRANQIPSILLTERLR